MFIIQRDGYDLPDAADLSIFNGGIRCAHSFWGCFDEISPSEALELCI
jgi:hypothetical protein